MLAVHRVTLFLCLCVWMCQASHFRGGTINYSPTGNGLEVRFQARVGWRYGHDCDDTNLNMFESNTGFEWECVSGCPSSTYVNPEPRGYTCVYANKDQDWGRGEHTFTYTFPDTGPFLIRYTGGAWISGVGSGSWTLQTTVDLTIRSDTSAPNTSPVAGSKSVYYIKRGCDVDIQIPVTDADGDNVRCRWATNDECNSVCQDSGVASIVDLTQENCTIRVRGTQGTADAYYAVALTVEDYPRTSVTIGSNILGFSDVISSIPLQFLVQIKDIPNRNCSDKPIFVTPTPDPSDVIRIPAGSTLSISIYATSPGADITSFFPIDPPSGVQQTTVLAEDNTRNGVYFTTLTWTPTELDQGTVTLCVEATDNYLISAQTCFDIIAWDVSPCASEPCFFNGTCTRIGLTQDYNCTCAPGYTSRQCHIDIDECASDPCQNDGTCIDLVNGYSCLCAARYTGTFCEIEIDECASSPCMNGATCFDLIDVYFCGCVDGFTGIHCEQEINECHEHPCENGGTCRDLIGSSVCDCIPGTFGTICQSGLNHCLSLPCQNDGICHIDAARGYWCECQNGWMGKHCAYRHENGTFGNNIGMSNDYMHYSDCDCRMGNRKSEHCYKYTLEKDVWFGILGASLGILTSVVLYIIYLALFSHLMDSSGVACRFNHKVKPETIGKVATENVVMVGEEEPEVENRDQPVCGAGKSEEKKPVGKKHRICNCWVCDVKINNSEPPLYYRNDLKIYKNGEISKSRRPIGHVTIKPWELKEQRR